jgi:hypothetical protein
MSVKPAIHAAHSRPAGHVQDQAEGEDRVRDDHDQALAPDVRAYASMPRWVDPEPA